MAVLVVDKRKQPLMPCSEKRARKLLAQGRAAVHRKTPFTIRLKDRVSGALLPPRLKLDPGSRVTGMALVREQANGATVLWLGELSHRGTSIRKAMDQRRALRHRRRGTLRYRPPRFLNRTKPKGWLAPSLQHRIDATMAWVDRLRRLTPVTGLSQEPVRFDTQALQSPSIAGTEYQQGTLAGYEVQEYLLEQWGRCCAYCNAHDVPLRIEHISPRARGGSDRVANLTLSCGACNQRKGSTAIDTFLAADPDRLRRIMAQAERPLRSAAAVNATRWALYRRLKATKLPVEIASGGRTKWNRSRLGIPKTHALDAACVGQVERLREWRRPVLFIKITGRGNYQRTRLTRHGFPRGYLMRRKQIHGFQTGDWVRASGSSHIQTRYGAAQGINHRPYRLLQRADGYGYDHTPKIALTKESGTGPADAGALSLAALIGGVSRAHFDEA